MTNKKRDSREADPYRYAVVLEGKKCTRHKLDFCKMCFPPELIARLERDMLHDHESPLSNAVNAATATGRLFSSGPAAQNIPIRTELGMEIRRALLDEKGRQIVPADYSQIELRILDWLKTEEKA